jgi:omega-hydroxy-beta-dihydromenaquinone-9 sulfotransferase
MRCKAKAGSKAERTRQYVSISSRLSTRQRAARGFFIGLLGPAPPRPPFRTDTTKASEALSTAFSDNKMIFVTGASRSGTTLMNLVLRNHSRVFGLKELHYFGEHWDPRQGGEALSEPQLVTAAAWIFARQRSGILRAKPAREDIDRARALLASLPRGRRGPAELFAAAACSLGNEAGKAIPCEQTPRNIFYARALLDTYPHAHVVHMLRDPRGVMASQKHRWRRRKLATDAAAFPLTESLRVWVNYHPYTVARLWRRASAEAARLEGHARFTIIRFEDLLEAPEKTIRALGERLELGFEPAMLDVSHVNSSHQSSVGGARKGWDARAIDTWRRTLSAGEITIAERSCGELMHRFGYARGELDRVGAAAELTYRLSYPLHLAGVLAVNPKRAWIQLKAANRLPLSRAGAGGGAS